MINTVILIPTAFTTTVILIIIIDNTNNRQSTCEKSLATVRASEAIGRREYHPPVEDHVRVQLREHNRCSRERHPGTDLDTPRFVIMFVSLFASKFAIIRLPSSARTLDCVPLFSPTREAN